MTKPCLPLFFSSFITIFLLILLVSPVSAVSPRTHTLWTVAGAASGVNVIPYIRIDKRAMFVDFEDKDFSNVRYIYYKLEYESDGVTKRGIEGSFVPVSGAWYAYYQGKPYFRKELTLGTVSGEIYYYHNNPHDIKLTVNTNMLSGKIEQYTQVLSFPANQFTR